MTEQQQRQIVVKYGELEAKYASQVIVNTTNEEVFLDFSSGIMNDPGSNNSMMHIHTRIAMTQQAAQRLIGALQQGLQRQAARGQAAEATEGEEESGLPSLDV